MLGRADPVGVDRLRVRLVHLAAPGEQEALGRGPAAQDLVLRHRRQVGAARRLRHDRERGGGEAPQVLLRLLVAGVDQLAQAPAPLSAASIDWRSDMWPPVRGSRRS